MALLDLISLTKMYESNIILNEIEFNIKERERIAIIGKNGGGKSTFMRICQGGLEFDDGRRVIQQNIRIKMLSQQPVFDSSLTVKEAIESELVELKRAKEEYDRLSLELESDYENRKILNRHATLSSFLDTHNGWNLDDKIERVLQEFHLKEYEDRSINLLSGGEQRRVALAGLLLQKPDILLLDEPTNHLDVYMVEFVERVLLDGNFTLIFISHDRYFLDNVATRIVEIEDGNLRNFKGGYSSYLKSKREILNSMEKSHQKLLKLLKSEEEWLSRGVKARVKRDEGRRKRVLALREEAKKSPSIINKMRLELEREQKNFNSSSKNINRKKMLFEIENISKKLGEKSLIKNFSMRILQRDTIAVVGKNGSGKSTFLKLLLGDIGVDSGEIKRGDFKIGYFDQQREMLDDDKNLIETLSPNGGDRVDVRGKSMHIYGYLKNFLFPKEHLDKKIGLLSGGEKSRVALALLFTKKYDCIIMDEPTNDLDISTINILEEYLQSFEGALIFVSHDRYFVDKIAKKLLIFKGDGDVVESYQSYSDYLNIEKELSELETFNSKSKPQDSESRVKSRGIKLSYKEKRELETLPIEIERLEKEIEDLNLCLQDPECYEKVGLSTISDKLRESEERYEFLVDRYLLIEEKVEMINNLI